MAEVIPLPKPFNKNSSPQFLWVYETMCLPWSNNCYQRNTCTVWLKPGFQTTLKYKGKDCHDFRLKIYIRNSKPRVYILGPGPPPIIINKVLLKQGCSHSSAYSLWLLLHYSGRVEWLRQRPYAPQRKNALVFSDPL